MIEDIARSIAIASQHEWSHEYGRACQIHAPALAKEVLRLQTFLATLKRKRDEARADAARLRAALDGIPCPECKGDGELLHWDEPDEGEVAVARTCEDCNGSGQHPEAQKVLRGET